MAELILMTVQPLMLTPLMSDNQHLKAILTKLGQEIVMKGRLKNAVASRQHIYTSGLTHHSSRWLLMKCILLRSIYYHPRVPFISSQYVSRLSYSTVTDFLVFWFTIGGRCFSDGVLYNASYLLAWQKIIQQLGKPITHIRWHINVPGDCLRSGYY